MDVHLMNGATGARNLRLLIFAVCLMAGLSITANGSAAFSQAPAAQTAGTQRTVWYFYRVKWGFQDEFIDLFRRKHYTVLKEQVKTGQLLSVKTYVPTFHGDGRADWTFAFEVVYRDANALMGPSETEEIERRLFPDRAKFQREERRRFEILDAHWDVPLNLIDLDKR